MMTLTRQVNGNETDKKSGRGLPHSKTSRNVDRPRTARSVLDCGAPAPLSAAFDRPTDLDRHRFCCRVFANQDRSEQALTRK